MIADTRPIKDRLQKEVAQALSKLDYKCRLIIVLIGDDLASQKYTQIKKRVGEKIGIKVVIIKFDYRIKLAQICKHLSGYCNEPNLKTGLIFQLPIQNSLWLKILDFDPWKKYGFIDVDILHKNTILNDKNGKALLPPTISAIFEVVKSNFEFRKDLSATVIGQGRLVGKHVAKELIEQGFTTHSLNEYSHNIEKTSKESDIIISAAGSPNLINYKFINKNGQLIVDASTSEDGNKLVGDVDLISVCNYIDSYNLDEKVKICKSPGGIGPLTVLRLFYNLVCSK